MVDSAGGDGRVDDNTLALGSSNNSHLGPRQLLDNERGDIGFETASPNSHDDQTDDEGSERAGRLGDDRWDSRDNKNNVSQNGDCKCDADCLVAAKMGICHIGTEERNQVNPELVECSNSR